MQAGLARFFAQMPSRRELPSGTVTFLFSDLEGSTRLLEALGSERYGEVLSEHRECVRRVVDGHAGVEMGTEGDAFFIAFARASDALAAAREIESAAADGDVRVRIGIHTGEPSIVGGDYVGVDVHKVARICAAAHGGQIVVSQATRELAGAVDLHELGEHRLKDLSASERLFQVGSDVFPPLRTLGQTNLPVQPSPVVGRARELADLVGLVRRNRMVTLTGTGGCGKTRLALELAAELSEAFPDGVWWVALGAIADPTLVLPTIAQTVGAQRDLQDHFLGKRTLLLLDNFEQVVDAAASLADLVMAVPGLSAIVTSRERLAVSFEQEYPVPPLTDAAAAELFASRARHLIPDFEPDDAVREICGRLDNLPLALELASTRVKVLTTAQILTRLERRLDLLTGGGRDAPQRQATMRAAISWSYDLLDEEEQILFRRLAVFAGGFELEAAEEVCLAGLDLLQSLVDKSLLRQSQHGRFFLLETTREFAVDQLEASGEGNELRRRHAEWFLLLARRADEKLHSREQSSWLRKLRAETDNLRAVLAWSLEHDVPRGVELLNTVSRAWMMWGQLNESISWLDRALATRDAMSTATRAIALRTWGDALFFTNQPERAQGALTESIASFREVGDKPGEASVLNMLGGVRWALGAAEEAIELREQALEIFRELGDRSGVARSLHLIGEDLRDIGEFDHGAELLEEAMRIDTELGDAFAVVNSSHSLGDLALDKGDATSAARWYLQGLETLIGLGDERGQAYHLAGLACVAALRNDARQAGRLWQVAEAVEERLGQRFLAIERQRYERILSRLQADPEFQRGCDEGQGLELRGLIAETLSRPDAAGLSGRNQLASPTPDPH